MIRERSELDAIASEIHASGQPIALDLKTYGTSEDKKIRRDETLDPWRGEIRLLSLQLPLLRCFVWIIARLLLVLPAGASRLVGRRPF